MAVQPPFRSDAIQIENADAPVGPRLVEASLLDGSLRFTDPRVPGGINLAELAGLQRAQNTIVVSQTGEAASKDEDGNPITTIQGGLDAVPDGADVNNPWVVYVAPGLYAEDVIWVKDGVELVGLSRGVRIRNLTPQSSIRVRRGLFTVPQVLKIRNVEIEQIGANACVDVSSATFASGTVTFASVPLVNDTFIVNGVALTAVAAGTAPGAFEFELGATTAETAENAAEAISNPLNGLVGVVIPTVVGNVVTLRSVNPGLVGNALTLNTTVPLVIVISGANFTGGQDGEPNSAVASNRILLQDCTLVASAPGRQLLASSVNFLQIKDCEFRGSSVGSSVEVVDCAGLDVSGVLDMQNLTFSYDSGNPNLPAVLGTSLTLNNVQGASAAVLLQGVGSMVGSNCQWTSLAFNGDRSARLSISRITNVVLGGTFELALDRCYRNSVVALPTATLEESYVEGSASFLVSSVVPVVFAAPQPDVNYTVSLESTVVPALISDIPFVFNKTVNGFDIQFGAAQTTDVRYIVTRNV